MRIDSRTRLQASAGHPAGMYRKSSNTIGGGGGGGGDGAVAAAATGALRGHTSSVVSASIHIPVYTHSVVW